MKIYDAVLETTIDDFKEFVVACSNINEQEKESGYTALHYCAQEGKVDFAKVLVEKGADLNIKDVYGNTPLFKAVFFSKGDTELIDLLLINGADPDVKNNAGVSPRMLAGNIGSFDVTSCFGE